MAPFPMPISAWVTVVAALWLIVVVYRQTTGQGWHWFAIPILAVTTAVFGVLAWRKIEVEVTATKAVRELTGLSDVRVVCRSWVNFTDNITHAGWVSADRDGLPSKTAQLSRDTCNDLRDWLHSSQTNPTVKHAAAVLIVAHEAGHLAGDFNEANVECKAIQQIRQTAMVMGATPGHGQTLAEIYYEQRYPLLRDGYRSAGCVQNGTLDLSPGDNIWP